MSCEIALLCCTYIIGRNCKIKTFENFKSCLLLTFCDADEALRLTELRLTEPPVPLRAMRPRPSMFYFTQTYLFSRSWNHILEANPVPVSSLLPVGSG